MMCSAGKWKASGDLFSQKKIKTPRLEFGFVCQREMPTPKPII